MLRVLGLGRDDPLVWQRAFLTAELDEVLGGARRVRAEPAPLATAAVREQYRRLSGGGGGDAGCTQQRPVEGDCPICFDEMTVGGEAVEYCRACLNNFHAACLKMHKDHRHATGVAATCPLCRAPLEEDGSGGAVGTYIRVGSGAAPSLNELYGDRSIWIHAHQGAMSMGEAAALTINTIATKLQDHVVVGLDKEGNPITFKHPALQTAMMFAGEMLCLLPFAARRWWNAEARAARPEEEKERRSHNQRRAFWLFSIPALCDACGTTLLNLGLFYTYASVFQMLRGTLVIFAGALTIVLLKRRLHLQHWRAPRPLPFGMVLICAGAALVGASSIIYDCAKPGGGGTDHAAAPGGGGGGGARRLASLVEGEGPNAGDVDAPNPLLGDVLVVLAQLMTATQFIIEEKFLSKYHAPVLFAVGMEGTWGMLLCCAAVPALAAVRGPDGLPLDSAFEAARQIRGSWTLQWTTALMIASIGRLSGASRASIDACRTILIWLFCLRAGWERFHMLQVVGFVALVSGTSIYNDLLRSCLPAPTDAERRHRRSRRRRPEAAAGDEEGGAAVQLLLDGGGGGGEAPAQGGGAGGGKAPRGVRFAPEPLHSAPISAGRPPRGGGRPRGAESPYTMARSVTILPQALSPHSLASVPSASPWAYGSGSLRSDVHSYSSSAYISELGEGEGGEESEAWASASESDLEHAESGSPAPAARARPPAQQE
eukprot:scaffold8.g1474.t1